MNLLFFIIVLEGVDMPSSYWLSGLFKEAKSLTYKSVISLGFMKHSPVLCESWLFYSVCGSHLLPINTLNRKSNKKCRVKREFWGALRIFVLRLLNPNATTTSPQGNLTTIKHWYEKVSHPQSSQNDIKDTAVKGKGQYCPFSCTLLTRSLDLIEWKSEILIETR